MLVKFENGVKDVNILNVTAENYIVPENEKQSYHCKIERKKFNPETGQRLSRPRIQKFGQKIFEQLVSKRLPLQGYTIEILWNPNAYLAELAEKKKASAENTKKAQEEKMQAQIEKAVEAIVEKRGRKKNND